MVELGCDVVELACEQVDVARDAAELVRDQLELARDALELAREETAHARVPSPDSAVHCRVAVATRARPRNLPARETFCAVASTCSARPGASTRATPRERALRARVHADCRCRFDARARRVTHAALQLQHRVHARTYARACRRAPHPLAHSFAAPRPRVFACHAHTLLVLLRARFRRSNRCAPRNAHAAPRAKKFQKKGKLLRYATDGDE